MDSMRHPLSAFHHVLFVPALLLLVTVSACRESENTDAAVAGGRADFQAYCASCHGRGAKGDGPVASKLQVKPADLTQLSKRFDGVFPSEYVLRTIDGREELAAHGTRTMPVWGRIWRSDDDPQSEVEAQRILTELLRYLESIQEES